MTELTPQQWFEDTINNIEQIQSPHSTYPKDKLVQSMRFVLRLHKTHNGNIRELLQEIHAIPEEEHEKLLESIGINYLFMVSMLIEADNLFKQNKFNYQTSRTIGGRFIDTKNEIGRELRNLLYISATKPYVKEREQYLSHETSDSLLKKYSKIHISSMDQKACDTYEKLFNSDAINGLLSPQKKCDLNINDYGDEGSKPGAKGWYAYLINSITLQKPDAYIIIHETFHLIDRELEQEHDAHFSTDERIAFFHELYSLLSSASSTNIINPFDYMEYDKSNAMVYKDSSLYDIFNTQINNLSKTEEKLTVSAHWMQYWRSRDIQLVGQNYFITPKELLARLYTTAYSIAYPELDAYSDTAEDYVDMVTLSAARGSLVQQEELKMKMRSWITRFNDYANATLHGMPRHFASKPIEQLSAGFNDDALAIVKDIQQACLERTNLLKREEHKKSMSILSKIKQKINSKKEDPVHVDVSNISNVFSIVHYKNAKINALFNEHIEGNLETYYKAGEFSPERKSHHILQALIDYKENKIPASDIMKKIGFASISIDDTIANTLCDKYKAVLAKYDTEMALDESSFVYKEAAMYL